MLRRALVLACAALVAATSACSSSVTCGTGTTEDNGTCLPSKLSSCPAGQALSGSQCKTVCGPGTVFKGAVCTLADAVCGPGTELVGQQCAVLDPLSKVTDPEGAEPNDTSDTARRIAVPAVGEAAILLGGIIDVAHDTRADFDSFRFTATAGMRLKIEATALGAPTIGVRLAPVDSTIHFDRYVASLESRGATRELIVPTAGDWLLAVSETSNFDALVSGLPRGGPSFSYVVAVSQVAPVPAKQLNGSGGGAGSFTAAETYDIPGDPTGISLLELNLGDPDGALPFPGARALWATDHQGRLLLLDADTVGTAGSITRMTKTRLIVPEDGATLGVDYTFDLGGEAGYTLATSPGAVEQITFPYTGSGDLAPSGTHIYAFEADANTLLHAKATNFGNNLTLRMQLRDAQFQVVSETKGYYSAELNGFVPAAKAGRWFLVCENDESDSTADVGFDLVVDGVDVTAVPALDVPGSGVASAATVSASTRLWFVVTAQADAVVTVRATPEAGLTISGTPYGPDMHQLGPKTPGRGTTRAVLLENLYLRQGGTLLIAIDGDGPGHVDLEVESVVPTFVAEREPNDTQGSAQILSLDTTLAAEVAGNVDPTDDVDLYKFTVPAPDAVAFTFETGGGIAGGTPDTYLRLYDGTFTAIAHDDDSAGNLFARITKTLDPGTYYLEVTYAEYASSHVTHDYIVSVKTGTVTTP